MNSINEKEKKLNTAIAKLKNLDLNHPNLQNNIENLSYQKNQLEIEKSQLEDKYKLLLVAIFYNGLRCHSICVFRIGAILFNLIRN